MKTRKRNHNSIPSTERGEPRLGTHAGPRLMVSDRFVVVMGSKNRICFIPSELGDGTPIWSVGMLWEGESTGFSTLETGPAWAYTFQAARAWAEKTFPK